MIAPQVPAAAVRLASWMAGRSGLTGELVDPVTGFPMPAAVVVCALLDHIRPALEAANDWASVSAGVNDLLANGTGSEWQRRTFAATGQLAEVALLAADATQPPALAS